MIDEFLAALQEVERSRAQVLIVAAEGKAFCAGMDLEDLQALVTQTAEENHRHSQRIATLFRSLYEFPKTTIAAVNGAAIAGGAGVATLCDFTLASTAAQLRLYRGADWICAGGGFGISAFGRWGRSMPATCC